MFSVSIFPNIQQQLKHHLPLFYLYRMKRSDNSSGLMPKPSTVVNMGINNLDIKRKKNGKKEERCSNAMNKTLYPIFFLCYFLHIKTLLRGISNIHIQHTCMHTETFCMLLSLHFQNNYSWENYLMNVEAIFILDNNNKKAFC